MKIIKLSIRILSILLVFVLNIVNPIVEINGQVITVAVATSSSFSNGNRGQSFATANSNSVVNIRNQGNRQPQQQLQQLRPGLNQIKKPIQGQHVTQGSVHRPQLNQNKPQQHHNNQQGHQRPHQQQQQHNNQDQLLANPQLNIYGQYLTGYYPRPPYNPFGYQQPFLPTYPHRPNPFAPPPQIGLGEIPNSGLGQIPNSGLGQIPNSGLGQIPNPGLGQIPNAGITDPFDPNIQIPNNNVPPAFNIQTPPGQIGQPLNGNPTLGQLVQTPNQQLTPNANIPPFNVQIPSENQQPNSNPSFGIVQTPNPNLQGSLAQLPTTGNTPSLGNGGIPPNNQLNPNVNPPFGSIQTPNPNLNCQLPNSPNCNLGSNQDVLISQNVDNPLFEPNPPATNNNNINGPVLSPMPPTTMKPVTETSTISQSLIEAIFTPKATTPSIRTTTTTRQPSINPDAIVNPDSPNYHKTPIDETEEYYPGIDVRIGN
ncbi:circumsporozoite protein-like [Musca vetustissima]|uniref:circumsporozoite protein-like n=1 Tax=Musca vetustissima TaxID=27455 RepID=UPI002AB7EAFE|nr:circumsporozoite protein-like [Musca vetustissima]